MVSPAEYLFCLINHLTHFKPMFHLCRNQIDTFSAGWDLYFICHVTPTKPLHWDVMHIYGWEFLAVCYNPDKFGGNRHFDSSEEKCFIKNVKSYKCVLSLKNWVDWITTRQEKNVTTSKMYILRKSAQKFKNIFFPL